MIIAKIDKEIEKYADRFQDYPTTIKLTEKEYEILKIEMKKELAEVGRKMKGDITDFRGCELIISPKITKFVIQ